MIGVASSPATKFRLFICMPHCCVGFLGLCDRSEHEGELRAQLPVGSKSRHDGVVISADRQIDRERTDKEYTAAAAADWQRPLGTIELPVRRDIWRGRQIPSVVEVVGNEWVGEKVAVAVA